MLVRELFARLGLEVDESGFKKADRAFGGIRQAFSKAESELARFGLAMGGLREIYQLTFGRLKDLLGGVAENALQLERTSQMTGLTTDALQGLEYAAMKTGLSAEELRMGLVRLARSANEARMGGAGAALAYQTLGVHVANAATGKLRPLNDLFFEVAQKLSRMPDGAQKAALSLELLGRSGAQLLPLLNQGPAGIAAFTEEAKKLGYFMGGAALKSALAYRNATMQLGAAVQGLKNSIALQLFPAMAKSTQQFAAWIAKHREWIALHVKEAFEVIAQVLHGFVQIGKGVVDLFERIWKSGRTGKVVLIGLAVAAALLTAPWLSLIAVLALVANSIERYLEGKSSFFGRIVYAFERLGVELKKTGWGSVIVDVFTEGLKAAKAFFEFVEEKLPNTAKGYQDRAKGLAFAGGVAGATIGLVGGGPLGAIIGALVGAGVGYSSGGGALAGKTIEQVSGRPNNSFTFPAFPGFPSLPEPTLPGAMAGAGAGVGQSIVFAPIVNVTSRAGDEGKQVGSAVADALRPMVREEIGTMLREASAHTNK